LHCGSARPGLAWRFALIGAFVFASAFPAAAGDPIDASIFAGDEPGDFWTYREDGQDKALLTRTVLEGTVKVGGIPTSVTEVSGGTFDGNQEFSTYDDQEGARLHRDFLNDQFVVGLGTTDIQITFKPPLRIAHPLIVLGEAVESSGDLDWGLSPGGDFDGSYDSTIRYVRWEPVTVPFGTFDALLSEADQTLEFEGQRQPGTQREWLVPGIGTIKVVATANSRTITLELTDTNRELLPEPSAPLGAAAALVALTVLRCSRAGAQRTS
jgi:hypothetical protein